MENVVIIKLLLLGGIILFIAAIAIIFSFERMLLTRIKTLKSKAKEFSIKREHLIDQPESRRSMDGFSGKKAANF